MIFKRDSQRAECPSEFKWAEWKRILNRTREGVKNDRVSFNAAAVAFYTLLAVVPVLSAVVSIFGFFTRPDRATAIADQLKGVVPPDALNLIREQLVDLSSANTAAGIHSLIAIIIALWGGSKAMKAIMVAMNLAYDEEEDRGLLKRKLIVVGLTAGTTLVIVVATTLLVWWGNLPLWIRIVKWPAIFFFVALWISIVYRLTPNRSDAKWRWISPGAVVATVLWIFTSWIFSLYTSNFGKYNETYGSLGGVVVLLLWLYLSAVAIIVGAKINAEMEMETSKDTTVGEPEPMGERGAYVSDHSA
ncbi:MAG: YihY/virulence factor BrkB family protein [Verrucomicrobiales bacterium]|nr:YihY/virulence factor BrkB family protein [Verrucomicrobiales bacterium]